MSPSAFSQRQTLAHARLILLALILASLVFTAGCGSSMSSQPQLPQFTGNTMVTVVLTSTANDQLAEFDLGFQSVTLTSQSGKTATLLSLPTSGPAAGAEFMHINGTAEPLVAGSIPQDIYTAATVTFSSAETVCIGLGAVDGQESLSSAFYSSSVPTATVTLPSPITVTGTGMSLSLNLIVSQSATIGDCVNVDGFTGFSITPNFNLTPLTIASSPTNAANGKVTGLDGEITALAASANNFTLSLPSADGQATLSVSSNHNTVYQGAGSFSALEVGTFVDLDAAIQSDGTLLATRVAVEDRSAGDVVRGPLMQVTPAASTLFLHAREQQGKDFPGYVGGFGPFNDASATFQISGQLTNIDSLPFVATFNASSIVPGQEVYISAAAIPNSGGSYPVATTITLMPQTIDGTVVGSSTSGNFADYTVSLASYDLFPMLAAQPGQTTVENNPGQVEVYVDNSTQLLNTQTLAAGSTFRFYGLVFNDSGTLRMDCAQVNDGVDFTPPPAPQATARHIVSVQPSRRESPSGLEQVINAVAEKR
jgi:hypothetical protein